MKILAGTLIACVALVGAALGGTLVKRTADQHLMPVPERPLVFVPGLMGSMLCRPALGGQEVVWGGLEALAHFPSLALRDDRDDIEPCGVIREISFLGIFSQSVYAPFIQRLEQAGYIQGETLFVFDYDWRLSVVDSAERLSAYVERSIPDGGQLDIVGHSMGASSRAAMPTAQAANGS